MKTKQIVILMIAGFSSFSCDTNKIDETKASSKPMLVNKVVDEEQQKIVAQLQTNDSLLFELGFNQCDTNQVRNLTSSDFELYHDQAGITNSRAAFIQSIVGLCSMDYRPTREPDINSFKVHLLKQNGKVYGAIQNGTHRFYGEEENKPKYLTSTADFTHLWVLEDGNWKLRRVLSFNHQVPK